MSLGTTNENIRPNQIDVIVEPTSNLIPSSSEAALRLQHPTKSSYSGNYRMETDMSDNETVFVTTEDDGAGGTVTFVQNIKGENISKDDGRVQTEYIIEDNFQATTVEIDDGKTYIFLHIMYNKISVLIMKKLLSVDL